MPLKGDWLRASISLLAKLARSFNFVTCFQTSTRISATSAERNSDKAPISDGISSLCTQTRFVSLVQWWWSSGLPSGQRVRVRFLVPPIFIIEPADLKTVCCQCILQGMKHYPQLYCRGQWTGPWKHVLETNNWCISGSFVRNHISSLLSLLPTL